MPGGATDHAFPVYSYPTPAAGLRVVHNYSFSGGPGVRHFRGTVHAPAGSALKPHGRYGAAVLVVPTDGGELGLPAAEALDAAKQGRHGLRWEEG